MRLVGFCAVASLNSPRSGIGLSKREVERIASASECVIVEAFDGGGFLIWWRPVV
jgi:hypothetical protein